MGGQSAREAVVKTGDLLEGRYRIISTLGEGGMGTVFLAEHALIKRRVAVKLLHQELAKDESIVERFMNEARAAGTLGHPNIVESTDMGFTHDHVPFIVFEYLEGTLLTDEIYRVGGLPVRRAVRIAEQIASALQAAHNAAIIHRDLKSDNIFLTDKDDALDHVKVLDFGVSRFLEAEERSGMVIGTPEFMAPEQITRPDHIDKRADVYALGVILYEMLTARRPFSNDDDPRQLLHRIVHEPPPPLLKSEVPHGLESMLFDKMLAKDAKDRFQTMADVQAALEQFTTGGPVVRRRSAPVVMPVEGFDAEPQTSVRLPKMMQTGRMPVAARDTPWPAATMDTPIAMGQVSLPDAPPSRRPYALYGVAAAGILMGMIGLIVGLRGGDSSAPAPIAQTPPPLQPAAATLAPKVDKIEVSLDADAPNAHVVFRRRVNETPVKMEINATDVVELVEVSAPGYKTTRFWLTFDRATYLKAHLVKGSGSVEATEEQTLAALGEVIMVSGSAPAVAKQEVAKAKPATPSEPVPAVAARSPAPRSETPSTAAMAPRKIGRSAAEPSADPAPAKEPEKAAPAAVAKDEPNLEEDLKSLKDDPKPEPPKPTVVENVEQPSIDRATVSSVISTHRPEVLRCFADGKKRNPAMKGTLSLQLQVDNAGKVHRVQVQSTLNNPLVAACVVKAANAWKFPTRAGGDLATVAYPFTIN